jgi:Bifunctional DNA primase/polymerase, N-terminal/Primase C terminal 1 (PriCT-1)
MQNPRSSPAPPLSPCDAALSYAQQGWPVFPVHSARAGRCSCGDSHCRNVAKHPRTRHGLKAATIEIDAIRAWWADWPDANVAIRTGTESGLIVLDVDPRHGGDDSLLALFKEYGHPPITIEVVTGGGGRHLYFAHPGGVIPNRAGLRPGLDLRGDGGYVVAPPSSHASGTNYHWADGSGPGETPPVPPPKWLLTLAQESVQSRAAAAADDGAAVFAAAQRYVRAADPAPAGQRNDAAFRLAGHLFSFQTKASKATLSPAQVLALASEWNSRNAEPLPAEELAAAVDSASHNGTPRAPHVVAGEDSDDGEPSTRERDTQAAKLVRLADGADLFCSGEDAFATVHVADHYETHGVRSRAFRTWLTHAFYAEYRQVPKAQSLIDALGVLQGRALFGGTFKSVAVRIAAHNRCLWLDLADSTWSALRIDPDGWTHINSSDLPLRFVRRRAMRPLPMPVPGGSIHELRRFVNVRSDDDWTLLLGWIVAALNPQGPFPVLHVDGEQGTAKTTLCRILRALIDPNQAPLRSEPRDARDLMIAASNAWLLAFDNISGLPSWLSDGLCRLATGGGFSTRELYSDGEEVVFDSMRPVIVNGIESVAARPDLLDRCVTLTLQPIPPDRRMTEADLWTEFERARPRILGSLLTAVITALRRCSGIRLPSIPRMADFAVWVTAAEPALGLDAGAFLKAYEQDRSASQEAALENSSIGRAIAMFAEQHKHWVGTASELLVEIEGPAYSADRMRRGGEWPRTPKRLAGELRRLAPCLRSADIYVELPQRRTGREKRRLIVLEYRAEQRAAWAARAANAPPEPANADSVRPIGGGIGSTCAADGSTPTPVPESETTIAAHAARCGPSFPASA